MDLFFKYRKNMKSDYEYKKADTDGLVNNVYPEGNFDILYVDVNYMNNTVTVILTAGHMPVKQYLSNGSGHFYYVIKAYE